MTFDARMAAFLSDASITALVGTRAFAVMTTQHPATPYLFWQRIATVPQDSHDATAQLVENTVHSMISRCGSIGTSRQPPSDWISAR